MSRATRRRIEETVRRLHAGGRGWSVAAVALGWFLVVGTMLTLPAVLPRIKLEFGLTNAEAGLGVTVLWLVYGVCQFPAGLLTDRVGERRMLLAGMGVGVLTTAAFALTPNFAAFVATCGVFGVVGGLFATPRVTLISRIFPDRSGTAIGAVMSVGNVGAASLPVVVGLVAAAVGWRYGFGVEIPLFLLAFGALWLAVPAHQSPAADVDRRGLRALLPRVLAQLRTREVLLTTAGVTLTFFTFQGMTAFLTTYLVTVKAVDERTAALLYGGLFTVAAITQPLAGRVSDQTNERIVLVSLTGVYALLLVALVVTGEFLFLAATVVLLGTQRGGTPVATAYLAAALPEDVRGGGYGLLRTVFTTVSSTAAVVVGLLADGGQFDTAFLLLASLAALATCCYLVLPKPSTTS